jgi:alanine racemase
VQLPCWVEVDLDAIAANVRAIQAAANPHRGVTAVVKAQAYGLGAVAVARTALAAGARAVAVGRVAEAEELRAAGLLAPGPGLALSERGMFLHGEVVARLA